MIRRGRKSGRRWFFKRKSFWAVCFLLFGLMVAVAAIGYDIYTKEYKKRAESYDLTAINVLEIPSIIYDREGKELGRVFVQNRSVMKIGDVPKLFIDALRAGEDSRFLDHDGIDYIGVIRAVKLNYQAGETTQGASTITQQLARNAYPLKQEAAARGESGIERKMVEAFLAERIEKKYSKDEILEFYLNRIYFGSGFYGLRSASLGYFGKEPAKLTLAESATIVGLIRNPTNNSPLNNLKSSKRARDQVITRMRTERMITKQSAIDAKALSIRLNPKPLRRGTSHLYERVADFVGSALGENALAEGGYSIHTTISLDVQNAAERALAESLRKAEDHPLYKGQKYSNYRRDAEDPQPRYLQGAVFMFDHRTGEVIAHVGGRDYTEVPFDFIEMGRGPLGTAFFPFLYATALQEKYTLSSKLKDEPMDNRAVMIGGREGILGEWGMEVQAPVYEGQITLRNALEESKIAATVRLGNRIGVEKVIQGGVKLGLPMQDSKRLPRVNVGWEPASLKEATRAISTFPLLGKKGPDKFIYVARIENQRGSVVYRNRSSSRSSKRLLDSDIAWQIHDVMQGGMSKGSARGLKQMLDSKSFEGAGKGGTTPSFSDAWFLGYNGRVSCGVWTGYLQGAGQMIYPGAFSRDLAMPVWAAAMNAVEPTFGGKSIRRPDSLVAVEICSVSGQRHTQFCQELKEDITTGTVKSVTTRTTEYFQKENANLPFCSLHSGVLSDELTSGSSLIPVAPVDAIPIRPKEAALIGDDPYHTETPNYVISGQSSSGARRSSSVLDSFDLDEIEEPIKLQRPKRLIIQPD